MLLSTALRVGCSNAPTMYAFPLMLMRSHLPSPCRLLSVDRKLLCSPCGLASSGSKSDDRSRVLLFMAEHRQGRKGMHKARTVRNGATARAGQRARSTNDAVRSL